MGPPTEDRLLTRTPHWLQPDSSRILSRPFVPGQETLIRGESRATPVLERILKLPEDEVERALARTVVRYSSRYRDLAATLDAHFQLISHRLGSDMAVSEARRRLIGAYFSQEAAIEAAALANPSIVPHPDQSGCGPGEIRFVMSLRAVGEGHLSCIEFRTGTVSGDATVTLDPPGQFLDAGQPRPVVYDRDLLAAKLSELGSTDDENARFLWSLLPRRFVPAELDSALGELARQRLTRESSGALAEKIRWIAACTYAVEFGEQTDLSERVLAPSSPVESHGMEDARFVRFAGDDGPVYLATFTAFDGSQVSPQMLETTDFLNFTITQLSGPSARNKGMAVFPRRIGGQYVALSRWDRESNAVAYSDDGRRWGPAVNVQTPARTWELTQLGNCGSPIETPMGWLVLTHGVGPMREYAIGAMLLDLDRPEYVRYVLPEPLLVADEQERNGYVPNVVYSCGAMPHGDTIVLPYGCSDSSVRIATVDLPGLLGRLRSGPAGGG
jgi:predicted GH43/DUF377 family glycosyl hydrolase